MGRDKALVSFRGEPMISHVATALTTAGLDVLVVGREIDSHRSTVDVPGLGGGPAIGLLTAFRHVDSDLFLVAVDQPLLRPETVRSLLESDHEAVVPMAGGHPQVTCAVFRRACHQPLETAVAAGEYKLRRLLDRVDTGFIPESTWAEWGEDGRSWLSLDTPQAVSEAEALR